jgi:hypothetical protein
MKINQLEVYITPDGLGRAAIVMRGDGLLEIYIHWIWSQDTQEKFNISDGGRNSWINDQTPIKDLYEDINPSPGIYQTLDDARKSLRNVNGFKNASLLSNHDDNKSN